MYSAAVVVPIRVSLQFSQLSHPIIQLIPGLSSWDSGFAYLGRIVPHLELLRRGPR